MCENVGDKENGVQCEICDKWWNTACAGLRQEKYTVVQESATNHEQVLTGTAPSATRMLEALLEALLEA